MSMHQGIDLSRFKKISSDKKTTTLRHSGGHEIKIAHSGLSPKMKEKLESMPVYGADGVDTDPAAPAQDAAAAPAPAPVAQAAPTAIPPKPANLPVAGTVDVVGQRPPPLQPINADDLKQQDALWQQDLANQHVKPETYQDLYGKKDTLGKIGTLFGLMVSGAGAGLSGQPNAVQAMMQKEIDNDFEAQKASKINAHNFLTLAAQKNLNNAQIDRWVKEGVLTDAQAQLAKADANVKNKSEARIAANSSTFHNLVMNVQKMPVGSPDRAAAEQKLALLLNGVQTENYNIADRAAAASALAHAAFGASQPPAGAPPGAGGDNAEQDFQGKQQILRMSGNAPIADDKASRHFPGINGSASIPLTTGDREEITSGLAFQKELGRFIDWTRGHSGDLNPKDREYGQALAAQLQGAYRMASKGGVYKEGEQGFISHIIDSDPTKFFNEIRVLPKLQAVKQESAAQLDQRLKSHGFEGYTPEQVAYDKSGKKWTNKGGKFVDEQGNTYSGPSKTAAK